MPVNPALAVTIPAGVFLYRITAVSFHTPAAAHDKKVVNGMGRTKEPCRCAVQRFKLQGGNMQRDPW